MNEVLKVRRSVPYVRCYLSSCGSLITPGEVCYHGFRTCLRKPARARCPSIGVRF